MPNYCEYEIKVTGKVKNIKKFYEILNEDYDYSGGTTPNKHFCRVFNVFGLSEEIINMSDEAITSEMLFGNCAWSVYSCMSSGKHTYYDDFKKEYGEKSKATTLAKVSEELELIIEVYSREGGCEFAEHFIYKFGKCEENNCVEYLCIDEEDEIDEEDYDPDDYNCNGYREVCELLNEDGEFEFEDFLNIYEKELEEHREEKEQLKGVK